MGLLQLPGNHQLHTHLTESRRLPDAVRDSWDLKLRDDEKKKNNTEMSILVLICCVILGKSLSFLGTQFPIPYIKHSQTV